MHGVPRAGKQKLLEWERIPKKEINSHWLALLSSYAWLRALNKKCTPVPLTYLVRAVLYEWIFKIHSFIQVIILVCIIIYYWTHFSDNELTCQSSQKYMNHHHHHHNHHQQQTICAQWQTSYAIQTSATTTQCYL